MFENLSSSDQQSFFYSLLLLVFLLSSFFLRRQFPWLQALKYMAWWAILAAVLIGLYAYRYEISGVKDRVLGAINPTKARVSANGQLIIEAASDGHFYLDAMVNNAPIRFMIDTGASDIVIDAKQAQKIGINTQNLVFNKRYETANGESFGASVELAEIEISGTKFFNVAASINSANLGVPLLGMSFLRKFKKYEFYQDRLILTP